jgi:hypothetical protein
MITRLAICSWGLSKYCASAVQGIAQCDNALELIEVFGPSGALLYSCRHSRQPIDFHIRLSHLSENRSVGIRNETRMVGESLMHPL